MGFRDPVEFKNIIYSSAGVIRPRREGAHGKGLKEDPRSFTKKTREQDRREDEKIEG